MLNEQKPICLEDARLRHDEATMELDRFVEFINTKVKQLERQTPRQENRQVTSGLLKQQIVDIEFSSDRDETSFLRKVDQLRTAISNENQRAFANQASEIKAKAEAIKKANASIMDKVKDKENRERIILRLKTIKEASSLDSTPVDIDDAKLDCVEYDLDAPKQSALFQPYNLLRRMERRFQVVIEQARSTSTDLPRRANQGSRFVHVWGLSEDVEKVISFLNKADMTGRQRRQYEKRQMGSIIGRSGVGLSQLEELGKAFVYVDGAADVLVFGPPEGAKAIFEQIEKNKAEVADTSVATDLPIDQLVARAVTSLNRAVVQSVEAATKSRVVLLTNPSDGTAPRVIIRARQDLIEAAKAKVKEEIIDAYVVLDFPAPNRAINRLLVPPKNVSETAQSRLLHEEFRSMRETLGLFVDRYGTRPAEGSVEDDASSGIKVVCHQTDKGDIEPHIKDLIERASYTTARVPIEREQLRKFTPENRALVEATSKCQVMVSNSQAGAFLNLLGSEEAIDTGKKVIAEILQREGCLETVTIDEPEVLSGLLRDRAARLRALEAEHNVSLSVYRENQTCKIVGDEASIMQCAQVLQEMCEERKAHKAMMETLTIEIESRRIPQLIGRQGATINDIRSTSGVESIQIPSRNPEADNPESPVCITVTGLKKNVEVAQSMIERILQIRSAAPTGPAIEDHPTGDEETAGDETTLTENPYLRAGASAKPAGSLLRGRGRGRGGRTPTRGSLLTGSRGGRVAVAATSGDYDEDFPSLPGKPNAEAAAEI
eukprot:Protomagalhaensia_sp_Gyna_25__2479@NODE_238_length_4225_cov_221_271381_g185_i0_p1_GENE_NODE_238_length_4225_cov_221_271381_g185_i0NODE_238_length_4225_cov_221_271381_g185_i0_p1_ORF_typecomplete_len792_score215_90KH_1/PF00013_29/2_3e03KH_1/PF00013_29/3_9e02KH_1/PF00013_29/0_027KH_1/PF00013_29/23KH_1/PF00013_29/9_4e02KH_1/PF00013_29/10KH_1/PF00013_29/1_5e11SLS/PF14611_6/1_1e03SLS/PF14611_6/4SLS/PF14611_6/1_4e03SLS/PF14611_6/2_7e05SLS/PF14611_6/4_3KH_4/PF13083_6/14KH_4/PF13083_6/0_011KH_2/PF07650_1